MRERFERSPCARRSIGWIATGFTISAEVGVAALMVYERRTNISGDTNDLACFGGSCDLAAQLSGDTHDLLYQQRIGLRQRAVFQIGIVLPTDPHMTTHHDRQGKDLPLRGRVHH